MNKNEIKKILEENGAIQEGHFRLSSGLHSDVYVQCAKVLQFPQISQMLGDEISEYFSGAKVNLVLSPALGGVIIGYMVALSLGARMAYAERRDGKMQLRRGMAIDASSKALIVEDVITTGASVQELIDIVNEAGGKVAGVGSLIERDSKIDFGVKKVSLLEVTGTLWNPDNCPICKKGVSIEIPGSNV